MVKIREVEVDFLEEAPQSERRRDIRIKNHKIKDEADSSRRMKLLKRYGRGR